MSSCAIESPRRICTDESPPATIRCAVIGGMMQTGMWPALVERFEQQTGHRVEVVASGPKHIIAPAMREGRADLLTMHASDTIINLVADGHAIDPQPWTRNDLVIVGPSTDPAGIRDQPDAAEAIKRIARSKSPFVIHQSLGAVTVLRNLQYAGKIKLDPDATIVPPENPHTDITALAAEHGAYTIVGRIPFLSAKMNRHDLEIMVQGDPRLRRPYVVVIANPDRRPGVNFAAARQLALFLRSPETQDWLAEFGKGKLDNNPIFFPITLPQGDDPP